MNPILNREEFFETPFIIEEEGPAETSYPGFFKSTFALDGARISSLETQAGFLKRNFEKKLSQTSWSGVSLLAGKLNGEAPLFSELAVCLAIEKILELEVTERSSTIRVIVCELTRISSHLRFLAQIARTAGQENLFHYTMRDREVILDLLELISGSRYGYGLIRAGGVASDVTEGFLERVLDFVEKMNFRLKEYNDLFTFNQILVNRTRSIGNLSRALAGSLKVTGANARSVGLQEDVRRTEPYCNYELFDFEIPLGASANVGTSDVHERIILRLRELMVSLELLRQALEILPSGKSGWVDLRKCTFPNKAEKVSVESALGKITYHLYSSGKNDKPEKIEVTTPSKSSFMLLPHLVKNELKEDMPLIVASLDLSIAEVDL